MKIRLLYTEELKTAELAGGEDITKRLGKEMGLQVEDGKIRVCTHISLSPQDSMDEIMLTQLLRVIKGWLQENGLELAEEHNTPATWFQEPDGGGEYIC